MRTSMGPGHSPVLRIRDSYVKEPGSGQTGDESDRPAVVASRVSLEGPPSPVGKGKVKVNEIRYLGGSEYLRAAVQNAEAVGPGLVEPSFGKTFATRYRPPFGVHVWCPDLLTSYVVQVSKMVCFFEAAFENDLCFSLHPFIKRVLQHFNVCPSQLSPNFWGALVGLLVIFRDKGLGIPRIALLLDLFSVKEAAEGFLYISKRSNAKLIILDLSSSHKHWKEPYFFVSGRNWEYNPPDREDTLGIPTVWTTPENLREFPLALIGSSLRMSCGVSNFSLVTWPLSIRPGLSPEDEEVKWKLVKCGPRMYSEIIRSNILEPSGVKSSRPPALRPSPPSVMKPSHGYCCEGHSGRASSPSGGVGKEEEEI